VSGHIKESWSEEISPYLERLAEAIEHHGRTKEAITIRFEGAELKVCIREQKLVLASQQTGGVALPPRLELVKFGIGLQAKILYDLKRLESSETNVEVKGALEALKSDGVIGSRIAYEMRTEINELTSASRMDESMKISDNRRALRTAVELANSIAEANPDTFRRGDQNASSQLTKKRGTKAKKKAAKTKKEIEATRAQILKKATTEALKEAKKQSSRVTSLSAGEKAALSRYHQLRKSIAIALVVIFILVAVGVATLMTWERSLPTFAATDFDDIPGLEDVIVRSSEILIVVNQMVWDELTTEQKREAVRKIAETVGPAGYDLAEFRTQQTPGLAFWTKDGTIRVDK